MKEIPLSQGKVSLVDDDDYEWLNQWKWTYKTGYAYRNKYSRNKTEHIYMHSVILKPTNGLMIDHKDRNGLNNQRANLRLCTPSQNCINKKKQCNNKSGFRGVSRYTPEGKWVAQIAVNGRHTRIGFYSTKEAAAVAYDLAAIKYHGEFAVVNFPEILNDYQI